MALMANRIEDARGHVTFAVRMGDDIRVVNNQNWLERTPNQLETVEAWHQRWTAWAAKNEPGKRVEYVVWTTDLRIPFR